MQHRICPACEKPFYVHEYLAARAKRLGHRMYCSKQCSNVGRGMFHSGTNSSSYKDGKASYRSRALRAKGYVCEICGYNATLMPSLLWVHHKHFKKKHEKRDDSLGNLQVLCVRCHLELHLLKKIHDRIVKQLQDESNA